MRPIVRKLKQRKTIHVAAVQPEIVDETDAQRLARVERLPAEVEKADLKEPHNTISVRILS